MAKRRKIPRDRKGWVLIPTIFRDKQTQITDEEPAKRGKQHKKKFVPPPTPEEFRSYSHIPLENIEGT